MLKRGIATLRFHGMLRNCRHGLVKYAYVTRLSWRNARWRQDV